MAIKDDLETHCAKIFNDAWTRRDGKVVPSEGDLKLGNDAVDLDATIIYADLSSSTQLVYKKKDTFAAEIYKTFLYCAAKIIASEGGVITSYDGDRVMGVFIGGSKNTNAVRAGLKINWATKNIVQPKMKAVYKNSDYIVKHTVGIDSSKIMAARTGIRGSNDIVWVGTAANNAAKLSDLSDATPTWITKSVYDEMNDSVKFSSGKNMWVEKKWTSMNDAIVYCSTYWWSL